MHEMAVFWLRMATALYRALALSHSPIAGPYALVLAAFDFGSAFSII
jgi:hypothetical protein